MAIKLNKPQQKKTPEETLVLNRAEKTLPEKLKAFYALENGELVAKDIGEDKLIRIAELIKACYGNDLKLPDELLMVAAKWMLSHIKTMRQENYNHDNRSVVVRTYSSQVVSELKELYWILRQVKYPTQLFNFPVHQYNYPSELLDNWTRLHLVGLTHLNDQSYKDMVYTISRQSNTLFSDRYPLICVADPTQEKIRNTNLYYLEL